ncbi:MAG TPA: TIGR03986 family CRISPR-associated RAMP protein [Blastocatellia bacterium]|nr:TIGR03986 family CRISPR-associated RAMP protein [Blastocatellia bacterium]
MSLPKHKNPTRTDRKATAPYNFVPLPEKVVTAIDDAEKLPDHDTYANAGYANTGYFVVELETKSPMYVRCALTRREFELDEEGKDRNGNLVNDQTRIENRIKNTPHFFYTVNQEEPVIPGSSLRGMLRNLLEIVSYGKVQWVTDKQLFFRTMDDTAVGKHYTSRMNNNVEAGFLKKEGNSYFIRKCQLARVRRGELKGDLYEGKGPNQRPLWNGNNAQYRTVWIKLSSNGIFVENLQFSKQANLQEGRLVITGNMQGKEKEFIFLLPTDDAEQISVPETMIERFHDDDQLTQWQQNAFPKNKPTNNYRDRDGMMGKNPAGQGDPVFFLRERGELAFFGRAQMFRLPYKNCPLDLVPKKFRMPEQIDYAEALFGFVRSHKELNDMKSRDLSVPEQGKKGRAYAGRVFVTDAMLVNALNGLWLWDTPIIPKILSSPKPTSFQHYLTQQRPDIKKELDHYDSPPPHNTVIRGNKLYWHQGYKTADDIKANHPDDDPTADPNTKNHFERDENGNWVVKKNSKQHTKFKPVKAGVSFSFRIHFENLSDRELGALCWTLHPLGDATKEYCHSLGMGKSLGMGAIKLKATLHLTNRETRYSSLFQGNDWQEGEDSLKDLSIRTTLEQLTQEFETHLLGELKPDKPCAHLSGLKRIGMLLKMLEFHADGWGETVATDTLGIGDFRQRKVLPDPRIYFSELENLAEPTINEMQNAAIPAREYQQTAQGNRSPQTGSVNAAIASQVDSIRRAIKSLKGAGQVSLIEGIVGRIIALSDLQAQIDCARELQKWLKLNKLWNKEPHKSKEWHQRIQELYQQIV